MAQVGEQLLDHLRIAQARESDATVSLTITLRESDQRLDHPPQLLCLGQRRADRLVAQQRDLQIAHQRVAVRAVTRQLTAGEMVTHKEPFES